MRVLAYSKRFSASASVLSSGFSGNLHFTRHSPSGRRRVGLGLRFLVVRACIWFLMAYRANGSLFCLRSVFAFGLFTSHSPGKSGLGR